MLPCRQIQQIRHRLLKYVTKWKKRSYHTINIDKKCSKLVSFQWNKLLYRTYCKHLPNYTKPVENEFSVLEFVDENDLPNFTRIRNVLFLHTDDVVIDELKSCNSLNKFFTVIEQHSPLTPSQLAQAALTYRDLLKSSDTEINNSNDTLIVNNDAFQNFIKSVQLASSGMNSDELSCCILHLSKCGITVNETRQLIQMYEDLVHRSNSDEISISSITRFVITVKEFGNIWSLYTLSNIAPILFSKLDSCDNYDQFGQIVICFQRLIPILNDSTMDKLVSKCSTLLQIQDDPVLEMCRSKCVMKVCLLLTFREWHHRYLKLIKQLLLSLRDNIKYFRLSDVVSLHKAVFPLREPYEILNAIHEATSRFAIEHRDSQDIVKLHYLNLINPKMHLNNSDEWKQQLVNYSTKPLNVTEFMIQQEYFHLLVANDTVKCNRELIDIYWNRIVSLMNTFPSCRTKEKVLSLAAKYVKFSSVKNYKNEKFEEAMLLWLHELFKDDGKKIYDPGVFVTAAFLILYFSQSRLNFANNTWERIFECILLLNVQDNLNASFVLNKMVRMAKKTRKYSLILQYYTNMILSLNSNTLDYLSLHKEINIDTVNTIFLAYYYRDCVKSSTIFNQLCGRLISCVPDKLCSQNIREALRNLSKCSHLEPDFVNKIVNYCIKEKTVIHTDFLIFFLNHLFAFGYEPGNCDTFIEMVVDLMDRDKEQLLRNRLVQGALSLSYFNELPSQITDYIFDVKFLKDWEEEVQYMVGFTNIERTFMELNREVCVEYPHRDIPWFHKNYCRKKLILVLVEDHGDPALVYHRTNVSEGSYRNFFLDDVCKVLRGIVNVDKSIVENSLSPYYHKIDILLYTDRTGQPVDPDLCNPAKLRKTAILLIRNKTSSSPYYKGKGQLELNVRQLEMLGYKAVVIDKHFWNSMCMSELLAKENYLCSCIWDRCVED